MTAKRSSICLILIFEIWAALKESAKNLEPMGVGGVVLHIQVYKDIKIRHLWSIVTANN